jgi:hypothetical protein
VVLSKYVEMGIAEEHSVSLIPYPPVNLFLAAPEVVTARLRD